MANQLSREQVPIEMTWDLADIYPSTAAWEADLQRLETMIPSLAAYQGRLGEGSKVLLAFLQARDALSETFEKVSAYAGLSIAADSLSLENQVMQGRVTTLSSQIGAALSFVVNELLALPEGTLDAFLEAEPALAPYRKQSADIQRRRGHVLAPEAERALAALDEALSLPLNIWQRVTAADLACSPVDDGSGEETAVSIARWRFGFSRAPDRDLRHRAYESLAAGLDRHKHGLAASLAAQIKRNVTLARLRGYGSAVEMILTPQQVPESVYRTILTVVHNGMAAHVRRMMRLRRRVLGIERMEHYDLDAPLDPAFNPAISYQECQRIIQDGLGVLGDEYGAILEDAFRGRWIDWADNVGKRSGAFSRSVYGVHSYVFTTWQDQLRSALVLAHELGHAGAGMLASRNQIISNTGTAAFTGVSRSLFFIEAPSTANEVLVGRHLLDTTRDPLMRRFVIQQFMGTFTHNFVTHLLEAHFEQRLYDLAEAGQPITTNTVMDIQAEVFTQFYGDTVALSDGARLYWAQQPHFYTGLYPYTYSAGLATGFGAAESIREQGQPAVDRWLDTLRAGTTLGPLDLARHAGVDMTSPEPLQRAVAFFGQLVDELEGAFRGLGE